MERRQNFIVSSLIGLLVMTSCDELRGRQQNDTIEEIEFVKGVEEDRQKAPSTYDERYGTPVVGQEAVTNGIISSSTESAEDQAPKSKRGTNIDDVVSFDSDEEAGGIDDIGGYSEDYY